MQQLEHVSSFYGMPVWYSALGIIFAIIIAVALVSYTKVKGDFLTFLFIAIGIIISGFKWIAPIAFVFAVAAVWGVIDGKKDQKRSVT